MILDFLKRFKTRKFLGIDIGTSALRVIELSKKGQNLKLENYGIIETSAIGQQFLKGSQDFQENFSLSDQEIAQVIQTILKEAGIATKEVNFSIPDFRSFFTSFKVPTMNKEELSEAIRYEVRPYIPLPLSEITLDWIVAEGKPGKTPLKVLVVAVPNEVVSQYQNIARLANLKLKVLESEVFALARASTVSIFYQSNQKEGQKKINEKKKIDNHSFQARKESKGMEREALKNKIIGLLDIGTRSTTCSIIDGSVLKISHSFSTADNQLTERLVKSLNINYNKAKELKEKYGIKNVSENQEVRRILIPLIDFLLEDIKKVFRDFYREEGREVEKLILAGGLAWLPGLKEYLSAELKKGVIISNPFIGVSCPSILKDTLEKIGPSCAIGVGLAMKGLG